MTEEQNKIKKMKTLLTTIFILLLSTVNAQQNTEKYIGKIDNQKCILQYTIKTKEGKNGMEDEITYKGFITIGTKKIPITGYFEGNVIKLEEKIKGKTVHTITFDLSEAEDGFDMVGKRKINNKQQKILLKKSN